MKSKKTINPLYWHAKPGTPGRKLAKHLNQDRVEEAQRVDRTGGWSHHSKFMSSAQREIEVIKSALSRRR